MVCLTRDARVEDYYSLQTRLSPGGRAHRTVRPRLRRTLTNHRKGRSPESAGWYNNKVNTERIKLPAENSGEQSLSELAASQGVRPVTSFEALLGHSASGDESVEEFAAMLREWRSEGVPAKRQA
jgi:hypothetical protein